MMQSREFIAFSDLYAILTVSCGNELLSRAIEQWSGTDLVCGLAQYIHFNSVFGGGVASLAGEIARRQDLFRDHREGMDMIADQSVEIASLIFFAAVDEFRRRSTHRQMAKETFRALVRYYICPPKSLSVLSETASAIDRVLHGYYLRAQASDSDVFRAIGFHMGSEFLADQEFNIIDKIMRRQHAQVHESLKRQGAYAWIQVHTTVETAHLEAAIEAANFALSCYRGSASRAKAWVLEGFDNFSHVQTDFMRSLLNISHIDALPVPVIPQSVQGQMTS